MLLNSLEEIGLYGSIKITKQSGQKRLLSLLSLSVGYTFSEQKKFGLNIALIDLRRKDMTFQELLLNQIELYEKTYPERKLKPKNNGDIAAIADDRSDVVAISQDGKKLLPS
jgi:hypothetical protein